MSRASTSKKEPDDPPFIRRQKSVVLNTRTLRKKEGSIKKISEITQMLLTPINERMPRLEKRKRSSPKEKKDAVTPDEEKMKDVKKQVLVEGQEKKEKSKRGRKRKIIVLPEKVVEPTKDHKRAKESLLSMSELVRLADEDSLDDEEFMAILTCPSPVWWEDPPDARYSEEPIFTQSSYAEHYEDIVKCNPMRADIINKPLDIPETKKCDIKFMTKRCKLENLLGNIKNKITLEPKEESNKPNLVPELKTNEISQEVTEVLKIKDENHNVGENNMEENRENMDINEKVDEEDKFMLRSKKTSESTEGESFLGFSNEELLNDLENMDIPILKEETDSDNSSQCEENADCGKKSDENSRCDKNDLGERPSLIELDEIDILDSNVMDTISIKSSQSEENDEKTKPTGNLSIVSVEQITSSSDENADGSSTTADGDLNDNHIGLKQNSKSSSCQNSGDESCKSSDNLDPVSDDTKTEDNKLESASTDNDFSSQDVKSKTEDSNEKTNETNTKKLNKEQLVAVYKIITDETFKQNLESNTKASENIINEVEKLSENTNIATYYKKCKSTKRPKKDTNEVKNTSDIEETDTPKPQEDSNESDNAVTKETASVCKYCENATEDRINFNLIPDGKSAKYCLKCSSIFETETCYYCAKKNKNSESSQCHSCKVIN